MICENCKKDHDGSYGSGRFCSRSCSNSRKQTPEMNEARRLKLEKPETHKFCSECGEKLSYSNSSGLCKPCKGSIDFNDKEQYNKYQREYYKKNKEKASNCKKRYYKKNKKRIGIYKSKYSKLYRKRPEVQIATSLRNNFRKIVKYPGSKTKRSQELLGCSLDFFKNYIENLFEEGMTFENHGLYGWYYDHIKPLSKFNLIDEEEQKKAFHYTNIQPLWAEDNLKKGAKY